MSTGLHGDVLDRLGRSIASGERPQGAVLTLADLESELGVSRTVVREVVRVLEAIGMVESRRRVGITVTASSRWDAFDAQLIRWRLAGPGRAQQLVDLTELRAAIEPVAARLAATRADDATRRELGVLAARLRELGEAGRGEEPEYLATDVAFHRLLLQGSGNPMLAALQDAVSEVLAGRTSLGLSPSSPVPGALDQHEAKAEAVIAGDPDRAEGQARAIVMEVWGEVRAAVDAAG